MDKARPRAMDITAPRRPEGERPRTQLTRRWLVGGAIALVLVLATIAGIYAYRHRNDQRIMSDRYQVVYMLTGQIYFGKLQNTDGQYLTLKNVYVIQGAQGADAAKTNSETNIVQVSRQVYGPDDSMAIRADQVQFWQNLRTDSKVAEAIAGSDKK